jgi:single-stranded DNA-binding protein
MNRVFVVGNITSDIYFDRLLIKGEKRSYLRLVLMAERPRSVRGMRIVIWDKKAELYFPYLKKGSELAVIGQFESRKYKNQLIHEVVSENMLLLRNIDWERGESIRKQYNLPCPNGTSNDVFIIGEVLEGMQLEWFNPSQENESGEFAFLRLRLKSDDYLNGLRVTARGSLAELIYPYLQIGSKVAIDGYLQTRDLETGKMAVEVRTRNMTFLENINWEAGQAARLVSEESGAELNMVGADIHGD